MLKEIKYYFSTCNVARYVSLFISKWLSSRETEKESEITLLDTSIGSHNIGDVIIMDYCQQQIRDIFDDEKWNRVSTHIPVDKANLKRMGKSKFKFLCGTNILQGDMYRPSLLWLPRFFPQYHNVILLGTGWNSYSNKKNYYTKLFYKFFLSRDYIHAVRDEYTKRQLEKIGIKNVLCTACPTMWRLTPEFCSNIRAKKGKYAITTLTDYDQDPKADVKMFDILLKNYSRVYLWLQGSKDREYFNDLDFKGKADIILIDEKLESYDSFLTKNADCTDYVGTRLHGGIRALNYKLRTIIIAVDNRAIEIGKTTNLLVIPRENIDYKLEKILLSEQPMNIRIPEENIVKWKGQFEND